MFIDTSTKEKMTNDLCKILDISNEDLYEIFNKANLLSTTKGYTDGDVLSKIFNDFINAQINEDKISSIVFYHLTRRLDDFNDTEATMNLKELLTEDSTISRFFSRHNVKFINENNRVEIYKDNKHIPLQDTTNTDICYIRLRFGHTDRIDYCVNGFMLKDMLHKNNYTRSLWFGPEFIQALVRILNATDIERDYFDNSKFFCYEYLIPKSEIIFDDYENIDGFEKTKYMIKMIMQRLYDYFLYSENCIFDHDNPILRLSDTTNLDNSYLVKKYEISDNMVF